MVCKLRIEILYTVGVFAIIIQIMCLVLLKAIIIIWVLIKNSRILSENIFG